MKEFDAQLARNVVRLSGRIIRNRTAHVRELGLTPDQADCLVFLQSRFGQDETTITDLKEYLDVSHQTAQGVVQRMVGRGLLELSVSPIDARRRVIAVAPEGMRLLARLNANASRLGGSLLDGLSEQEQKQFAALIQKALDSVT